VRRFLAGGLAALSLLGLAACDEGGSPVVEGDPGGATTTTTTAPGPSVTIPSGSQPALWPTPGLVAFQAPEEVAGDFLEQVIGAGELGEFRQGDTTSGEIDVLFGGEGGGASIVRSTLLLRQLSPEEGWFVIAATNPNAAITSPAAGAEVVRGSSLHIEGLGRGFEGAVTVRLLRAGTSEVLAEAAAQGGAQADPAPFAVDLAVDLSALAGETLIVLVQGGVGLETDPGDFGAIPIVVEV
jgi:hypothetical protein